ncbi:MAG TPA: hypothetical protein VG122_02015 [Gemmata sp.]|jgi:hypothetical protein|nr:hypothetical protein [Gemmata sp.]
MTDSPTLTDLEPRDLAAVPDLEAVDGADTELAIEPTVIEPTPADPTPESAPPPITPSIQADKIAAAVIGWLADIERLPELSTRLEAIQEQTQAVYAEYSAGIREVNKRFSDSLRPLDAERKELETQVATAEAAKEQLSKIAELIQEPVITTKG